MKSLYSCSALSLAYPYFFCNSPKSFSFFPSTTVRSSSVSLPHFSFTAPLISFHFPFRTSSFMFALLSEFVADATIVPPASIPNNHLTIIIETVILPASLRYRLLSETRGVVCPNFGSVFVLWQEGAPEGADQSTSLFWVAE